MKEIKAIIQSSVLDKVLLALHGMKGLPGCTVSHVHGYQRSDGGGERGGAEYDGRAKLEIVVKDSDAKKVVEPSPERPHRQPRRRKIFVMNCEEAVAIWTGKRGNAAVRAQSAGSDDIRHHPDRLRACG